MEKQTNDQWIDPKNGFHPLAMKSRFLKQWDRLDYYETMLAKLPSVKILGYLFGPIYTRVILDTRKVDCIPFTYFNTYLDYFPQSVGQRVQQDVVARADAAQKLKEEREFNLSRPGNKVFVWPRYYKGQQFSEGNAIVISSDDSEAVVALDRYKGFKGFKVTVDLEQLSEYKDPDGARKATLIAERSALIGRIQVAQHGKQFGPHNPSLLTSLEERLKRTENDLTQLGVSIINLLP